MILRKYKSDLRRSFGVELWPTLIHTPWMVRVCLGYGCLELRGK